MLEVNDFNGLDEIIRAGRRFLITSHENPDGDALGSMFGLGFALEKIGKEVVFFNSDGVPDHLKFLPHQDRVCSDIAELTGSFDATFILDCPDLERVGGGFCSGMDRGRLGSTVIIDHHDTAMNAADVNILRSDAGATGEIVFSILRHLGIEPDCDIATCLYVAIASDTGSFRFSNTSARIIRIAADLVDLGADPSEIYQAIYENEPLKKIVLLSLVLPTLEVIDGGRIASVVVERAMFKKTGTGKADTEGFVNIPRTIRGVEVAVLFREDDLDTWKVSMRSQGRVNVARLAERFGGGGHERAAGCTMEGSLPNVKERLFATLSEAFPWEE